MGNNQSTTGSASGVSNDEEKNNTINLLLLGRTGTGKSTTGNNILQLGTDYFQSEDTDSSGTTHCQAEYSQYQGEDIKVVDMPGLSDAEMNLEEDLQFFVEEVLNAVAETPDGYNAVLVVTTFGRQSRDSKTTIKLLRVIFGDNVFKEYGVLVITRGDDFKRRRDQSLTFEDYCSRQTGSIKELYDECDKRAVLFDNITEDQTEMEAQRKNLFDLVRTMGTTKRHTPELFEAARAKRDEVLEKAEQFVLTDGIRKQLRLSMHALNGIDINNFEESNEKLVKIKDKVAVLKENISQHHDRMRERDTILKFATSLEAAVGMKQKVIRLISENREKTRVRERMFKQMSSESEKKNYEKTWGKENKSDENNINDMKKLMTDTESKLEAEYQTLRQEYSLQQQIFRYLVMGVVSMLSPSALTDAVSSGAELAIGLGGRALSKLATREFALALPGFVALALSLKKYF